MIEFDDAVDFGQNLDNFLTSAEDLDAELGAILKNAIGDLRGAVDEATRKSARISFNKTVLEQLDALENQENIE